MVLWDGRLLAKEIQNNSDMLLTAKEWCGPPWPTMVIEQMACYGMAVGKEVFDTVFWSGRFAQAYGGCHLLKPRGEVKMHLCHSMRAKDANIRQALIDRFGPVGTKNNPGVLYGIKSHLWSALALAVTVHDRLTL